MIRTDRKKGRTLGFKARSLRGSAIIEEPSSDTSVTSATSEDPCFIRETTTATAVSSTTSLTASNSGGGAFSSDTTSKNPWQWHQMLKEAETVRRKMVAQKLAAVEHQVEPLQQLVAKSLEETKKANRFIVGLAKAQERLAEALVLPQEEEDNEKEEEDFRATENNLSYVEDLPEKLRTEEDDGTSVCSVAGGASSTLVDDSKPKKPFKRRPSCNDGSAPPVFSICIPNPNATEETVYVLHKQHDLLQQTMARCIPSVKNIEALKESVVTKFVPFGPSEVVEKLKITESKLQLLWDNYCTAAKEVLAAQDATEEEAAAAKYSMGDVWVAELMYRSAVTRQAEEWQEYDESFPSVLDQVKEFEVRRRIKLHRCLQSVMQKQAPTFQRAHQTHADALEDWVHTEETAENGDETESREKKKRDLKETKKTSKTKKKRDQGGASEEKVVLSPKERIQQIADFAGATTVWDKPEKKEQETKTLKTVPSWDLARVGRKSVEIGGIDVDMYMDLSSDDDDLPLLEDAEKKKKISQSKTGKTSKVVRSGCGKSSKASSKLKKQNSCKPDVSKRRKVKSDQREVTIHNNLIVLDHESSLLANFMDRLLFSASLLESHYVVFSAVAGLAVDDDCLRASTVLNTVDMEEKQAESENAAKLPRIALVVVTCDLALHLFELPSTAVAESKTADENEESNAVLKLQPEDALRILLERQEADDRRRKRQLEEQTPVNEKAPSSPTKMLLRLRRNKQNDEDPETFQFRGFCPTASIALEEYNVRITRRGKYAVKLSSKNRNPQHLSNEYSRMNLELFSLEEQQALVAAATRGNQSPQSASRVNIRVNLEFSFSEEQRDRVDASRGNPSRQSSSTDSEVASF